MPVLLPPSEIVGSTFPLEPAEKPETEFLF
jgi:hypothetical protein